MLCICALDFPAKSESFEFLWYLHLKEPACVVGEQRQLCLLDFLRPSGELGAEDNDEAE